MWPPEWTLTDLDAPLNLERVAAIGHSAGGHLALWSAARVTLSGGAPGAAPRVVPRAVVSQAGIADLRSQPTLRRRRADASTHGRHVGRLSGAVCVASPSQRLPLGVDQLVLHGERDEWSRSDLGVVRRRRAAAGDKCELRVLPRTGHFEHIDPSCNAWRSAATGSSSGSGERGPKRGDETLEPRAALLGRYQRRRSHDDPVGELRCRRRLRGVEIPKPA